MGIKEEKLFPIQAEDGKSKTFIPWWLAEIAYKYYTCKSSQSLERIADRGGFGRQELVALLRKEYYKSPSEWSEW